MRLACTLFEIPCDSHPLQTFPPLRVQYPAPAYPTLCIPPCHPEYPQRANLPLRYPPRPTSQPNIERVTLFSRDYPS